MPWIVRITLRWSAPDLVKPAEDALPVLLGQQSHRNLQISIARVPQPMRDFFNRLAQAVILQYSARSHLFVGKLHLPRRRQDLPFVRDQSGQLSKFSMKTSQTFLAGLVELL